MSVSLREAQVTKILGNLLQGDKYDRDNFNSCLASILALFPPQLTEEEILQIITDWWEKEKKGKTLSDLSSALIGKCATPTFSGEDKPFNEKYGLEIGGKFVPFKDLPTDIVQLKKLIENPTKQNIPNVGLRVPDITGQKEYCECKISSHSEDEVDCNSCFVCHKPIFPTNSKPIPAEKKESEKRLTPYQLPEGSWCNHCKQNECWCIERQDNGDWGKPEPKPKDRIECCGICGGSLVEIRGKYPSEPRRKVCPCCCAERLDQIKEISDRNYGVAYTEK